MLFKFVIISLFLIAPLHAQYKIGGGYLNKSDVPFDGAALHIERNLPLQFPDYGGKVRLELDYFSSDLERSFTSFDASLNIVASFFFRTFQPYAGLGFGLSYFESRGTEVVQKYPFSLSALAGFDLKIFEKIYPFFEAQIHRYFSELNDLSDGREINKVQYRLGAGIKFNLNLH